VLVHEIKKATVNGIFSTSNSGERNIRKRTVVTE